jgi:hypothetical protein
MWRVWRRREGAKGVGGDTWGKEAIRETQT